MYSLTRPDSIARVALLAVLFILAIGAPAQAYPPLKPGVVKVDTGNRSESDQPPWTARLAYHGWDYNPKCDTQGARFDWFAPGQVCNERPVPPILGTIGRGRAAA
jgi:hypothetical protein